MKGQVLQENFAKALSLSSRFVKTNSQLPILSNVMLKASKTKLELSATNLETSLSTSIGAKVEEEGEITIPAKSLYEIVSNLSKGQVDVKSEKESLIIISEGFRGSISGINASEFPSVPSSLPNTFIKIPSKLFLKSVSQVIFSASWDETRPILTGILFMFEKESVSLVATDGFRLSQKKILVKSEYEGKKMILPKSVLTELVKIGSSSEEIVLSFNEKENQVVFGVEDTVLSSRTIDGEFPNFEKIIPKSFLIKISVSKEDLLRAVKLSSVFARDSANIIKLSVFESSVDVFAESSKSGSQKTTIDAKIEGGVVEIMYNFRFIEEFLNICEGSDILIELTDESSPGVFKDSKNPDFLHLIMPVKLS